MLKLLKNVVSFLSTIVIAVVIAYLVTHYLFISAIVPTGSMEPTIHIGDRIFISLISKFKTIKQGDIVVFQAPPEIEKDILLVKRVIAVGGDSVRIDEGTVYVNNEQVQESYVMYPDDFSMPLYIVPEGELFVLGDNRKNSFDCRHWEHKSIPLSSVKGISEFSFWLK